MKRVRWLSGDRILPMHGEVSTGDEKDLPDDIADGYIVSGDADLVDRIEEVKPQKRDKFRMGDES